MEKKEIYETAEKICNHFTKLDEKKYPRVLFKVDMKEKVYETAKETDKESERVTDQEWNELR